MRRAFNSEIRAEKNSRILKQLSLMELEFVDSQARSGPKDFVLLNVVLLCEILISFVPGGFCAKVAGEGDIASDMICLNVRLYV